MSITYVANTALYQPMIHKYIQYTVNVVIVIMQNSYAYFKNLFAYGNNVILFSKLEKSEQGHTGNKKLIIN